MRRILALTLISFLLLNTIPLPPLPVQPNPASASAVVAKARAASVGPFRTRVTISGPYARARLDELGVVVYFAIREIKEVWN